MTSPRTSSGIPTPSTPVSVAHALIAAAAMAPRFLAESRLGLARALWSRAGERGRARALARQARENAAGDGKLVAEIDAWLAKVD